jgi:hypothetical protein
MGLHDEHDGAGHDGLMGAVVDPGERRLPEGVFETQGALMLSQASVFDDIFLLHPTGTVYHIEVPV